MPEEHTDQQNPPKNNRFFPRGVLLALSLFPAALILLLDQWIKNFVVKNMREGESIEVWGEALQWHFIRNPGAAFSLGSQNTLIPTILASFITLFVFILIFRSRHPWWSLALGLVAGGALGNLTDRLSREPGFPVGHVVDYIAVGSFARFNLADMAVCTGVGIAMILLLRGIDLRPGSRPEPRGTLQGAQSQNDGARTESEKEEER